MVKLISKNDIKNLEEMEAEPFITIGNDGIEIYKGMVHLVWGKSLSGKTSLCLFIAKKSLKKDSNVLYWDMEGGVRNHSKNTEHIKSLKEASGNISFIDNTPSKDNFLEYIKDLKGIIEENNISTLVIDSIIYPVLEEHPKVRSSIIKRALKLIKKITVDKDVVTFITTHVFEKEMDINLDNVNVVTPIGGNSIRHLSDIKFYIENTGKKSETNDTMVRQVWQVDSKESIPVKLVSGKDIVEIL